VPRPRSALLSALLLASACGDRDAPDQTSGADPIVVRETPSVRSSLVPYRPLLEETNRAELDAGGLVIDFGTADQHKYTRGGWRTGWGELRSHEEAGAQVTLSEMKARRAWLDLTAPRGDPPRLALLRARSSVPGQVLTLHAGKRTIGTFPLAPEWMFVRAEIKPGAVPEGSFRLELRASRAPSRGPHAEIDWLWLATSPTARSPEPGPRVGQLAVGGTVRRAIVAPAPAGYSFYLEPPPGARFVADLGAAGRATFVLTAAADGAPPVELFRESVAGAWRERSVSLEPFAGRSIRLELATVDQDGEAGWGEPEISLERADPAATPQAAAPAPPRNLIVIVIDTQRADAFAPFAGPSRVARTPSFDALAARSTVFTRAYNNENWTKPSVATTLSGLYPTTHDTKRDGSELPGEVELLSERLKAEGFATAGLVANGYVSGKFGFRQGWDHFRNYIRESRPSEAEHVYGDAVAWLRQRSPEAPFFLYLQTIDPHVKYEVDRAYSSLYFDGSYRGPLGPSVSAEDQIGLSKKKIAPDATNLAWLRALYWGEVTYHDEHLGRFLADLADLGLVDSTLVVVTNDHGEELGERGRFGHGHQLYEEMVRAPLLFSYQPMFPPGKVVRDIVEHVDVAPTILDALDKRPLTGADGISFLPLVRGEPVQRPSYAIIEFLDGKRAVRVGRSKLQVGAGDRSELHDLVADPGETRDLAGTAPIARRMCEVVLGEGLAVRNKTERLRGLSSGRRLQSGTADIDPATRRQLDALGYFGTQPEEADEKSKKSN
jgi:choline-sulfatase